MLKMLARSLLGRFVGIGVVAGGFWLLFKGTFDSNIPLTVLGGALIPAGMWVMVALRKEEEQEG